MTSPVSMYTNISLNFDLIYSNEKKILLISLYLYTNWNTNASEETN